MTFIEPTERGYVYRLTFADGKCYIGQTYDFIARAHTHASTKASAKAKKLRRAFEEHGRPVAEIIFVCRIGDLPEFERYFIASFDSCNTGYNTTKGGEKRRVSVGKTAINSKHIARIESMKPLVLPIRVGCVENRIASAETRAWRCLDTLSTIVAAGDEVTEAVLADEVFKSKMRELRDVIGVDRNRAH